MNWSPDQMLAAVQEALSGEDPWRSGWEFQKAELEGAVILVTFRSRADLLFGVHYPLDDLPGSPYTGEPCETPQEWAAEIRLDIEEQVATGGLATTKRTIRPDGVVLLGWHG